MKRTKIILTPATRELPEKEFVFEEPAQCLIGRARDCDIQLPGDEGHADVSRHHCLLDIDPPKVRVSDLGSRNGTYVNGEKIGQRIPGQQAEEADIRHMPKRELDDGDEIQVGQAVFRVRLAAVP
jgi:pSer/pThr/pTyr-binding forkhead associated (FHA) protein